MATTFASQRISRPVSSRLSPATRHDIFLSDRVRVYHEGSPIWEGPSAVDRIWGKQAWLRYGTRRVKQLNVAEQLPEPKSSDDSALRREHTLPRRDT